LPHLNAKITDIIYNEIALQLVLISKNTGVIKSFF